MGSFCYKVMKLVMKGSLVKEQTRVRVHSREWPGSGNTQVLLRVFGSEKALDLESRTLGKPSFSRNKVRGVFFTCKVRIPGCYVFL